MRKASDDTPFNGTKPVGPKQMPPDAGWAGKSPAEFTTWLRKREADREQENQTAYRTPEGNAS